MNETRRALLDELPSGPVPGPALADRLGVSRAAVWKQVEALRDEGFDVDSTDAGYVVRGVPEFGAAAVEYGLDAPYTVEYHDSIGSTNDRARELATAGETDVVVLADEQTGGRGRLRRAWSAPSGGVWLSVVFDPACPTAHAPVYTLAAAVATTRAAREAGVDAVIKWPNDLLVADDDAARGGRKLAGILTEMEGEADRVSWLLVGVGVNANVDADALPDGATSIRAEAGDITERRSVSSRTASDDSVEHGSTGSRPQAGDSVEQRSTSNRTESGDVDRRVFVQRLLEEFHTLRGDPDTILDAWREHADTLGRRVRVETGNETIEGEAVDVTFPGALVVRTEEGERTVHAGDCEHLRPV